jgi:predicted nucleotidyltransferase
MKLIPPRIPSATSATNEVAYKAYAIITEFRKDSIHTRATHCINWLKNEMSDFHTLAVEFFGSKCYNLELVTSDVDLVVILGPGQNTKNWLKQVQMRVASFPAFVLPKYQPTDTFQATYLEVPVDIKPIKNIRTIDGACRSTDCLKLSGCESRDV